MNKKNIAVIFGGVSSEHQVSITSATAVMEGLPSDKYDITPIIISQKGSWYLFDQPLNELANNDWEERLSLKRVLISTDHQKPGLIIFDKEHLQYVPIDCYFPVLHGKNGEDGTIQGLLDLANIPYVGCGTLSSALSMDKVFAYQIVKELKVSIPEFISFHQQQYNDELLAQKIKETLGYPLFVKPVNAGSSFGITKVYQEDELKKAIEHAFLHDQKVICEKAIVGTEVGCAVYGNDKPETGLVGEISASQDYLDFNDKYIYGQIKQYVPARVNHDILQLVQQKAIDIYQTLSCSGLARIDFFIKENGEIIFNEINTMPGFTPSSRYPKMLEASGIQYSDLLDELIELALSKKEIEYEKC
ncbi:D-alanine-D-alanine ligase [Bacillus sp. TS-2]|nr:D-alanine-D-alanine ligase [Bacillus sp. TS-2]